MNSRDEGYNEWVRPSLQMRIPVYCPDVSNVARPHFAAFQAFFHQHPIGCANQATGRTTAQKISDYANLRQFERTNLYNEYYRRIGTRHQFTFSIGDSTTVQRWIALNRGRLDFSERDRAVLDILQPHYAQACDNVARLAGLQAAVGAIERVQEAKGEAMLVANAASDIEWVSRQARVWLRESLGVDVGPGAQLPDTVARWLRSQRQALHHDELLRGVQPELRLTMTTGSVVVRCAALDATGDATLLLRLEAPADAAPRCNLPELTRRENEVLSWLAQGKSNPEIAGILGLSVRTVYKHMENMFPKLGVENRGGAMLRALTAPRN